MDYNTSLKKLALPEYGRHVQMMVQYAVGLKNRDDRNAAAREIINVMGILQPHLRDTPDFKHKLWDHLFVMSDFKLDIDSPYPRPSAEELVDKPGRVPYPQSHIRQKHYGKIVVDMIRETAKVQNPEIKHEMVELIANQMKKTYAAWNRSEVANDQIMQDIWDISDGVLKVSPNEIRFFEIQEQPVVPRNPQKAKKKKKK